jgi:hypothetical protein
VTNHVTTNTKLASRPRSKETSFKFFRWSYEGGQEGQ